MSQLLLRRTRTRFFVILRQVNTSKYKGGVSNFIGVTIVLLFFNASAYDLITSKGIKEVPKNESLSFYDVLVEKSQQKKVQQKTQSLIKNVCYKKNKYRDVINEASKRYGVDSQLIKAIISTESCFNPKAVSPKGAQGLMQLMPFTAKRFGVNNSFDPAQNIMGGVKYLRFLLKHFKTKPSLAIAAYNAGEGAVDHYGGIPPYKETQEYVKKVLNLLGEKQTIKTVKVVKRKNEKLVSTCISDKKIRNYTYAHYGAGSVKRYYLVRPNDTFQKISHRVGMDVVIIKKLNKLKEDGLKGIQIRVLLLSECFS